MNEYVLQANSSGTEEDRIKQLQEYQSQLNAYGKSHRDPKGEFKLETVQEYAKNREAGNKKTDLSDVSSLQQEYAKFGGKNPEFLESLAQMQSDFSKRYSHNRSASNNLSSPRKQLDQYYNNQSSSVSNLLPVIPQLTREQQFSQDLLNYSILHNQNQLTLPPSHQNFMGGQQGSPYRTLAGNRPESEKMYDYLSSQETELLLEMSRLHPNSYNYMNKHDSFLKIRMLKNELEKSMIVSRVMEGSSFFGNAGTSTNPFNSVNRSLSVQNTSAVMMGHHPSVGGGGYKDWNDYQQKRESAPYESKEGFVIRFDYLSFIPPSFDDVQIHFGVFKKGQKLEPFLRTAMYKGELESSIAAKCMIVEKRDIQSVKQHIDAVLYFEMHANEKYSQRKLIMRAWTMHEIFDSKLMLNCGKFKVPFYSKQYAPMMLMQTGIAPIAESSMFIRICAANDPYLDNDTMVFIESEYKVPFFHLKKQTEQVAPVQPMRSKPSPQVLILKQNYDANKQRIEQEETERLLSLKERKDFEYSQMSPVNSEQSIQPLDKFKAPVLSLNLNKQSQSSSPVKKQANMLGQQSSTQNQSQSSFYSRPAIQFSKFNDPESQIASQASEDNSIQPRITDGVIVRVVSLDRFASLQPQGSSGIKVNLKVFDGSATLADSSKKPCEITSQETKMQVNSKVNSIDFEHLFSIKVQSILQSYSPLKLKNVTLCIHIVSSANVSLAWFVTPLFKVDARNKVGINNGRFRDNLMVPPVKKPPFGVIALKSTTRADTVVEYIIHDPDILESELKTYDSSAPVAAPKIPLMKQKIQPPPSQQMDVSASPRSKKSQNALMKDMVMNKQSEPKKITAVDGPRNLLIIEVDSIKNYTNKMSISYDLVVLREQDMVHDEFGNPSIYHFEELIPAEDNETIVNLKTTTKLPLDLALAMKEKRSGWQQYHILFKFVEVDSNDAERTLGWYVHQLYKSSRTVNSGKFAVKLFDQPIQVSPQLNTDAIKSRKETFSFSISTQLLQAVEYNRFAGKSNDSMDESEKKNGPQRVFTAEVNELRDMEENVNLQVNAALLCGDEFMTDDSGEKCTFQGDLKNCAKNAITFLEEYAFEIDMFKVAAKYREKLSSVRLVLYFLSKGSVPKYWFFLSVFDSKGKLRLGTTEVKVFKTPFQRFSVLDKAKLKESKATLKLTLSEGLDDQSYDEGDSAN